jgi:hypothetical protein
MFYEDAITEVSRICREAEARAVAKIASRQLGLAFEGIEWESKNDPRNLEPVLDFARGDHDSFVRHRIG